MVYREEIGKGMQEWEGCKSGEKGGTRKKEEMDWEAGMEKKR